MAHPLDSARGRLFAGFAKGGISTKAGWSYTVGLFEHYGHPEVIIFGMEEDRRPRILNWIGEKVKKGNAFTAEREHDWVLDNYNQYPNPTLS